MMFNLNVRLNNGNIGQTLPAEGALKQPYFVMSFLDENFRI